MTDLRSLRTLLAVVDYGSIHLAGRALYISHSTASRQIRGLEEQFGTTLFDRSATGVVPTQQCLAVADFARRMITESELLVDSFGGYSARVENITIATSTALGQTLVADAVNDVLKINDRVRISVVYRASLEALQVLKNRQADLCVNFSVTGQDLVDVPGVTKVDQVETRNFAVLDANHPLAQRAGIRVRDIADFPLATLPAGNTIRLQIEKAVRAQGQIFSPALECTCPILMLKAVAGTSMVAMMSERTLPDNLAEAGCRAVEIDDPILDPRFIQILESNPRPASESLDQMVEALRRHLPADTVSAAASPRRRRLPGPSPRA